MTVIAFFGFGDEIFLILHLQSVKSIRNVP